MEAIFNPYEFGARERAAMDRDGHFALPALLTDATRAKLTEALAHIQSLPRGDGEYLPNRFAAEFNVYLESLIGHPQLLDLVRRVLGAEIRYDHCVALNRPGGNGGSHWHSHEYGEDDPRLVSRRRDDLPISGVEAPASQGARKVRYLCDGTLACLGSQFCG